MRVDKWLWTARLFKTRALAARAVTGGRVHVDGVAVKPGREVEPGHELEITIGTVRRTVIVRSDPPQAGDQRRQDCKPRRGSGQMLLGGWKLTAGGLAPDPASASQERVDACVLMAAADGARIRVARSHRRSQSLYQATS